MFRKYFSHKFELFIITSLFFLSFLLRAWQIERIPAGFNADEASFGYDAYSILQTGKDQWGNFLPLSLKSFGDYKSPLYTYLTVPFVALLGLTKYAVRLPNALVGSLSVVTLYFLIKSILELLKIKSVKNEVFIPFVGALFLAVGPWSVMISRAGIEANLLALFIPLGILFFMKGLANPRYFIWSSVFFGLSLFCYHSSKILTPVLVAILLTTFRKELLKIDKSKILYPGIIFVIFLTGLLYSLKIGGGARVAERSIFAGALEQGAEQKIKLIQSGVNPTLARLRHNKYQVVLDRFLDNYFQYFSIRFHLQKGVGEGYYGMFPGIGVSTYLQIMLTAGFVILLLGNLRNRLLWFLVLWILIAPLPSALSTGIGYSGTRAVGMIPVLQILAGLGILGWLNFLPKSKHKILKTLGLAVIFLILVEAKVFWSKYLNYESVSSQRSMLVGSLEAAEWLTTNNMGKDVIVSRSISEPQIFLAFAYPWQPADYQRQTVNWDTKKAQVFWVDQLPEWSLGQYRFKSVDWKTDGNLPDAIIVARPDEIPEDVVPIFSVKYSDGTPAVFVISTKKEAYAKVN